jgi:hypothetical protein
MQCLERAMAANRREERTQGRAQALSGNAVLFKRFTSSGCTAVPYLIEGAARHNGRNKSVQ